MYCGVKIGDGSLFKEQEPQPTATSEQLRAFSQNSVGVSSPAAAFSRVRTNVMWNNGEMHVKITATTDNSDNEEHRDEWKRQPSTTLYIDIHTWAALVAMTASKRQELELRSFPIDGDKTQFL